MNENINLCELLKGHEGEIFYSPIFGELKFIKAGGAYPLFPIYCSKKDMIMYTFTENGKYKDYIDAEIMLFPSKDQRDWNKWAEEQKPKVPKTWEEFAKTFKDKNAPICNNASIHIIHGESADVLRNNTPIEKAALALLKIHQLIEVGYGGNITNEEWKDDNLKKYTIDCDCENIVTKEWYYVREHIAFHNKEQRDEFLSYPENVQLVKDFYMI